ncbi:MAG: hypothetical protein OCC45_09310 [Desulfotalea sp.]
MKKICLIILICLWTSTYTIAASIEDHIQILVPGTPSSLPILLAADETPGVDAKVVYNLGQAHASFLRGDANMVLTGLSVGIKFFDQGRDIKIISSYVSGLSSLVASKEKSEANKTWTFADFKGETIYLPFPGSPMEEMTRFFLAKENLHADKDINFSYGDFQSSIQSLRLGKRNLMVLPEPFVSIAGENGGLAVIDYYQLWHKYTGRDGYPQVALIIKNKDFTAKKELIEKFLVSLHKSIKICQDEPEKVVAVTKDRLKLPGNILLSALQGTKFNSWQGEDLVDNIFYYYEEIGKGLDEKYKRLF